MALQTKTGFLSVLQPLVCDVCYLAMTTPIQLPCRHVYCQDCILPWVQQNNSCPGCRTELYVGDASRHYNNVLDMTSAVAPIVWDDHDNFSVANIGIIRRDIPSFSAMTDDEIKGLIPGDLGSMTVSGAVLHESIHAHIRLREEVNNVLCNRAETTARHSIPQLPDFFDDLLDHDLHYTFTWRNEVQAYCLDYVSSNREAYERLKRTGRPLQEFSLELGEFLNDPELNGMIRSIATAWKREGKGLDEEYASRFYTRD